MRLFLAIDLPKTVKQKVTAALTDIKSQYPDFKWVSEENYHITLEFFGEVREVERIEKQIINALYDQNSFYLYSNSADLFIQDKITIYLNFRREKTVEALVGKIMSATNRKNNGDRKFMPHLTLARYKIPSKQQYFVLKKRLSKLDIDIHFHTRKLVLFQSILGGSKPIYKKVKQFNLL